jgi:hypothetical protein
MTASSCMIGNAPSERPMPKFCLWTDNIERATCLLLWSAGHAPSKSILKL